MWNTKYDSTKIRTLFSQLRADLSSVQFPVLIRVPAWNEGEGEVEFWNKEWIEHSRIVDACYPVSGGWWSVEGDFNPTIQKVQKHCYESPNHTSGHFEQPWLLLLKYGEIMSLHSDHHREMIHQGKVYWKYVNAECPNPL